MEIIYKNGLYIVMCDGKEIYYGTYKQCKTFLEKVGK